MKYALLIYHTESQEEMTEEEGMASLFAHQKFTEQASARVQIVGGEGLLPTAMSTSVRVRDGQTLTTDGPFAETKEALGGFYLIEAKDMDEAIEIAALVPEVGGGTVEIRPCMIIPEM